MSKILPDPEWNEAQIAFIQGLEAAGATKAEHAVPIDRTMGLPARDLQALLNAGVVREASANGYYVYPNQIRAIPLTRKERLVQHMDELSAARQEAAARPFSAKRFFKTVLFWIIVMLIPIILLQILGTKR